MFKVAIIGAGEIARQHIRAFSSFDDVEVVGIYSRTTSKSSQIANEFGIGIVAESIKSLFLKTSADLVVIAVTIESTKEVVQECWKFGWQLLVEKPLGINYSQCLELSNIAKKLEKDCMVAFNRRHYASVNWVMSAMENINSPVFISAFGQENTIMAAKAGFPEAVVNNWMYANAIHIIDLILYIASSKVLNVTPINPFTERMDLPVLATSIEFENGSKCIYQCAWNAQGPWGISITSSEKRWEICPLETAYEQEKVDRTKKLMPLAKIDIDYKPGFVMQAKSAIMDVRGASIFPSKLNESLISMKLVRKIFFNDFNK